ncbi:MAG: DMT family transporter [bacterium]|nr:DMT family transporter [bacterium]
MSAKKSQHIYGVVAVLLSAFMFYFSTVFVKFAQSTGEISPGFFLFARFILGLVMISVFMFVQRKRPTPRNYFALTCRALANVIAFHFFLKAVQETTVAHANILNMTYPIFMPFLSFFFLPKQRDYYSYLLSFVAFIGIVLVLDPSAGIIDSSHLWGLGSGFMASFAMLFLTIARRDNDTETVLFVMFLVGAISSVILFYDQFFMPTVVQGQFIFWASLTGILGQFAVTYGYRFVTAVEGGVLGSSRILIAAMLGPFITGESALGLLGWCGALVIFTVNVLISRRKEVE